MIRLYLDEDVHKKVAAALRIRGYDVVSAHEERKWGISDFQQLEYAVSQSRAIFTFNVGDFIKLHDEYTQNNKSHFGILFSKQIPLKETIKQLTAFLYKNIAEKVGNNLFWI